MGRVMGVGFRVGNSCTPVVDSCQCMVKPIQYCKVKKKTKTKTKKQHLEGKERHIEKVKVTQGNLSGAPLEMLHIYDYFKGLEKASFCTYTVYFYYF